MSTVACLITLLITTLLKSNEASRILAVFPTPNISHQMVFRSLILELVKRGHEVVSITPDPAYKNEKGPPNLKEVDIHELAYKTWSEELLHTKLTNGSKEDLFKQLDAISKAMQKVFEKLLQMDEIKNILVDKFDVLLLEACVPPLVGLTNLFKNVPSIQISSFGSLTYSLRSLGAPIHPLLYQTSLQQRIYGLTSWDEISEMYGFMRMEDIFKKYEDGSTKILRRTFGDDFPAISKLKSNLDMVMPNVHPIWEMNRPVPPNLIFLGNIHQKAVKPLPQDLLKYLDSSKNGVIYVSFGTTVEPALLPKDKIQALINAFAKLPYDILWKWNQDDLSGLSQNVKIAKWLPQSDLLRHPNIKLFITQGGLQSTDEAITAGVPLIGMPILGDQWYNVEQYAHLKIGLKVDMDTVTDDKIRDAVDIILGDPSYRFNILRLRDVMGDRPQTSLERAIWWIEYTIRNGGLDHMKSPSANMKIMEYMEVELILYSLLCLVIVVFFICLFISFAYRVVVKRL